jgi:hypothetical protein
MITKLDITSTSIHRYRRLAGTIPIALNIIPFRRLVALAASAGTPKIAASLAFIGLSFLIWGMSAKNSSLRVIKATQSNPSSVEAESITLLPRGFEPSQITRPEGMFLIAVDNRSGLDDVTFRLDREAGGRLREAPVSRKKAAWRDLVDLTPGTYLLTEASHPAWHCRIVITAK